MARRLALAVRVQKGTGIEIWTMTAWERSVSETMTTQRRRMKNSNITDGNVLRKLRERSF